jgi:hypothetical protein
MLYIKGRSNLGEMFWIDFHHMRSVISLSTKSFQLPYIFMKQREFIKLL